MAETIVIDIRTNYTDNMSPNIEASARSLDRLEQSLQRTSKMMGSLGNGGRFQASFDLRDNASKQMDSIMAGVKRLSGISTIRFAVDIIDRVTQPLQNIMSMAMNAGQNLGNMIMQRGWTRVTELDAAKAKLSGLGNSVQDIQEISQNASDAVTGTAYSLNEAVTAAASAVAAGMKPGAQLRQYLVDIADVAGISGRSMGEIGSIMNSVVTTGKAQNDTLQRLAERGLPIYQWLAKTLGTEEAMVTKMAKDGEIGIEALQAAIQDNIAGAAQEMGDKTILGVLANINSAYAKLGEAIIGASDDQSSLAGQAHEFLLAYKTDVNTIKAPMAEIGKTLAGFVSQVRPQAIELMDKSFAGLKDRLTELNSVMNSPEFSNAGLLGKFKIAWDTVIGDPFSKWWDSKGHNLFISKANDLGTALGSGLSTIFKGIFGFNQGGDAGGVVDSATSVGAGFAQGFLQGFDGSGVAKAIADSLARAFKDVIGSIFSGKIGGGTLLNGLLLAGAGRSLLGISPLVRGIEGLFGGSAGIARAGGSAGVAASEASTLMTGGAAGGGLINKLFGGVAASTGISTGLIAAGSIASAASATVAAVGGIKDLVDSQKQESVRERRAYQTSGAMKLGATGVGAAAGAIAAGPLGALIGAGLGGLIGIFTGNAIRNNVSKADKSLERLTKGTTEYARAADYATKHMATLSITTDEVNSAVQKVFGNENVFAGGVSHIQSGQTIATQMSTAYGSVQGMNYQMGAGISLTDSQAQQYVSGITEAMDSAVSSVTEQGTGMLQVLNTIGANGGELSDIEKQAYKDYVSRYDSIKTQLEGNQTHVKELVDQYGKGEISIEQLAKEAEPYLKNSNRLVSEFTGMKSSEEKLAQSLDARDASGKYSADSIAKLSDAFRERDAADKEIYNTAANSAKAAYGQLYGVGSETYNTLASEVDRQTLTSEAGNVSESLGLLNNGIRAVIGSGVDEFFTNNDWHRATGKLNSMGAYGRDPGAVLKDWLNFDPSVQASATDYGASIQDWVSNLGIAIQGLTEAGVAIPETMMSNYESGIQILAAAGKESALVQAAAMGLVNDATDDTSQFHNEALGIIEKILSDTEQYFTDSNMEQAFSDAISKTRWGKEIQQENYSDLIGHADNLAYETDKQSVYEGGGETEGYRYAVGKQKIKHDAEEVMKEAETYTVKAGDTVWGILKNFLGHDPTQEDLSNFQKLNADRFSDGNLGLINTGETFTLSEEERAAKAAGKSNADAQRRKAEQRNMLMADRAAGAGRPSAAVEEYAELENEFTTFNKATGSRDQRDGHKVPQGFTPEKATQKEPKYFGEAVAMGAKALTGKASEAISGILSSMGDAITPNWINQVGPETYQPNPVEMAEMQEGMSRPVSEGGGFLSGIGNFFDNLLMGGEVQAAETDGTVGLEESAGNAAIALNGVVDGADSAAAKLNAIAKEEGTENKFNPHPIPTGDALPSIPTAAENNMSLTGTATASLDVDTSAADAEIQAKGAQTGNQWMNYFATIGIPSAHANASIVIDPQVTVNEKSVTIGVKGQGGGTTVSIGQIASNAAGGLVSGAELSWLAEEGYPEMVIPFAPHRRGRALDLLSQAEDALGVSRHANGGVVGGMLPSSDGESSSDSGSSSRSGTVNVGGITFEINSNGGDVVSQVQSRATEITEIVTNALADALEQAYENTPLAAG